MRARGREAVRRSAGIREEPVHLGDVDGGRASDVRRHELGGHPVRSECDRRGRVRPQLARSRSTAPARLGPSFDNWVPSSGAVTPASPRARSFHGRDPLGSDQRNAHDLRPATRREASSSTATRMSRARCSRCSRTGASRGTAPTTFTDPDWWIDGDAVVPGLRPTGTRTPRPRHTRTPPGIHGAACCNPGGDRRGRQATGWRSRPTTATRPTPADAMPGLQEEDRPRRRTVPTTEAWAAERGLRGPTGGQPVRRSVPVAQERDRRRNERRDSRAPLRVLLRHELAREQLPAPTIRVPTSDFKGVPVDLPSGPAGKGTIIGCLRYHRQLRDRPGRLECHLP